MYNYLNDFSKLSAGKISIKNKSFLKDLLKGFKLKSVYTKNENNIENACDDLVFNNKKIDDVLYKKVKNQISDENKNIFQEVKKLFDLRIEIYKKLFFEEENLKFEKSIGETVKLKNQKDNLSETPDQKEFNDFLNQITEEQKNIDINLFKNVFNYETPDKMLEYLHSSKKIDNYNYNVDSDKNSENVPKLESVEVVLVHCNLVKNDYQHTSKVLFSFVPNKQFGQIINISPHSLTMMNTVNTEFSFVEVWFTDQISKALEIEDNVNLPLIIG